MKKSNPLKKVKHETWWFYHAKKNEYGEVDKYKEILVVKCYTQENEIDYTEVYAPVARMDTVRMIIAFAAQKCWKLYQLDVKSAFIYGKSNKDISVEQPRGYEEKGSEEMMYKLQKALYGLKQAHKT